MFDPITSDVMNTYNAINVTIRAKYKKLNYNKTRLKNVKH